MVITKTECTKLLHDHFVSDFSQIDNVWLLMWSSWWDNRNECLSNYW